MSIADITDSSIPHPSISLPSSLPSPQAATDHLASSQEVSSVPPKSHSDSHSLWRDLFLKSPSKSKQHPPPTFLEDGTPLVVAPPLVILKASELWQGFIVASFFGSPPSPAKIFQDLNPIWGKHGKITVHQFTEGTSLILIPSLSTRRWVLKTGFWSAGTCGFFVSEWSSSATFTPLILKSAPIWFKLRHVPPQLWTDEGIETIATGLGTPIPSSISRLSLGEAKIRVIFDLNRKTPSAVMVEDRDKNTVRVEVEAGHLPPQCESCLLFGHKRHRCPSHKISSPPPNSFPSTNANAISTDVGDSATISVAKNLPALPQSVQIGGVLSCEETSTNPNSAGPSKPIPGSDSLTPPGGLQIQKPNESLPLHSEISSGPLDKGLSQSLSSSTHFESEAQIPASSLSATLNPPPPPPAKFGSPPPSPSKKLDPPSPPPAKFDSPPPPPAKFDSPPPSPSKKLDPPSPQSIAAADSLHQNCQLPPPTSRSSSPETPITLPQSSEPVNTHIRFTSPSSPSILGSPVPASACSLQRSENSHLPLLDSTNSDSSPSSTEISLRPTYQKVPSPFNSTPIDSYNRTPQAIKEKTMELTIRQFEEEEDLIALSQKMKRIDKTSIETKSKEEVMDDDVVKLLNCPVWQSGYRARKKDRKIS